MLAEMDSEDLTGWLAYARINPFGELRSDFQAALICTVIASALGGANDAKPSQFMPFLEKSNSPPDAAELERRIRGLAQRRGAVIDGRQK